ncbi:hypothetical protein LSTR_LSTR013876 [Laodelphax striatellus]|uniref:Uncharacterized protein n=1 Tax=Laodelphax striatellus TaxID=195883 RepID=A0A482XBR7_LAOST|nr:hypothetical protein LSTR_LSTR013876 [Laodelphax striatellus]
MKKRDEDDKVPLTEIPPSITQETKARFESLLNAALNNESSKTASKVDDHCVIDIEKSDPPKPCPRTVTLKRKEMLLPANHSREGSSTSSKSSDDVFPPGLKKVSRRSQLVHSAEVHTSPKQLSDLPRQSLLSSPEQSKADVSKKPHVLPRSGTFIVEKTTTGWGNTVSSDTESSEVVTELKHSDKTELSTTEILEQVISSDTSDLVVAKMVGRKSSITDEKTEPSPLKVKVPIPLPRRSLTTSQKSGSTSDDRSGGAKEVEKSLENAAGDRKTTSAASLNILSSSSHDEGIVTRKKIKRKKKLKKHECTEQVGTEMTEIHSSAKTASEKAIKKQPKTSVTTMLGVTIHGTDSLQPHTLLRHPMVRVHIVDSTCGDYLKKSDPNRCVSFCEEDVDYILPIMTRHYDFKEHR